MNYKKWTILLFSISTLVYGLLFLVYVLIDPNQIFNKSITKYKFGYTKYYSKHQYEKLKKNEYTLVFGTSRSQTISTSSLGIELLNFHNIYGEPGDILNFLQQLDNQQIKNIKHIYYLVSLGTMRDEVPTLDYAKYSFIDQVRESFPLTNLSLKYLMRDIVNNIRKKSIYYYVDGDGSQFLYDKNKTTVLNQSIKQPVNVNLKDSNAIGTLLQIDAFCKKYEIKITYYTPTYTNKYKINIDQLQFLWEQLLLGGIDGFYGLYYLEGISDNVMSHRYIKFTDSSHLNYNTMNSVLKKIVVDEDKAYFIKNKQETIKYFKKIEGQ